MPMLCPVIYGNDNSVLTQFALLLRRLDIPQQVIYCDSDPGAIGDNVTLVLDIQGKVIGIDSQCDAIFQQQLPQRQENLIVRYDFHSLFFWTPQMIVAKAIVSELRKKYRFESGWHIYPQSAHISAPDESKRLLRFWKMNTHTITEKFPVETDSAIIPGVPLSKKFIGELVSEPETGMGYHIVSVILHNGSRFDQVVITGGIIVQIRGMVGIPFSEKEIDQIIPTHDKWNFNEMRALP